MEKFSCFAQKVRSLSDAFEKCLTRKAAIVATKLLIAAAGSVNRFGEHSTLVS